MRTVLSVCMESVRKEYVSVKKDMQENTVVR
jgi:hypothetical protein